MLINKTKLFFFLSYFLIFFAKPELYSILFFIFLFFLISHQTKKNLLKIIHFTFPIFLIIIFGFLFAYGNESYEVFKDLWLWFKVIIIYFLGGFLFRVTKNFDHKKILDIIVLLGLIHSFIWILLILFGIVDETNYLSGPINSIPFIVIIILPIYLIYNSKSTYIKLLTFITFFISIIFSYSRLRFLYLFIVSFFGFRFNKFSSYNKKVAIYSIITLFLASPLIFKLIPEQTIYKFRYFHIELSYEEGDDPHSHWRAFENSKAMTQFKSFPFYNKFFGTGHGTLIDLDDSITILAGSNLTYNADKLSVIHNGYLMILTKLGFFGIFMYLVFVYKISFKSIGVSYKNKTSNRYAYIKLLNSTRKSIFFIIIIHTFFASGLLNKYAFDGVLLFLGYINQFLINQDEWKT